MKKIFKMFIISVIILSMLIIKVDASSINKSKSATKLDKNYNTKITLNLNDKSKETTKLDIAIVFDVGSLSIFGDSFKQEIYNFINTYKSDTKVKTYFTLIGYGAGSEVIMPLTESTSITDVSYINSKISSKQSFIDSSGDRDIIQSGLSKAKEILDSSTTGSTTSNRHVILFTDGAPYNYINASGNPSVAAYRMNSTTYYNMNNMDSNGDLADTNRQTTLMKYLSENSNDYLKAFNKLYEHKDEIHALALKGNNYNELDASTIEEALSQGTIIVYDASLNYSDLNEYPYTTIEIGTVEAARELTTIKNAGYNIYTIGYRYMWGYEDDGVHFYYPNLAHTSYAFEMWTKNVGESFIYTKKVLTSNDINEALTNVKKAMNKPVEKNSYVIDEIDFGKLEDGTEYDFDFVNDLNKMDISINGTKLNKAKITNNKYGFGKIDDTNYKVVLTYYPEGDTAVSDNESFKLDINTDVDPGIPIKVEYNEVLKVGNSNDYRKYKLSSGDSNNSLSNTSIYLNDGSVEDFNKLVLLYNESLEIPDTYKDNSMKNMIILLGGVLLVGLGYTIEIKKAFK